MPRSSLRTVRWLRTWVSGGADLIEEELTLDRDGVDVPATLMRPRGTRTTLPGWIVLHGITRPGRAHRQLVRFTRTLASTGVAAIVPEVPEWRELALAPRLTVPTVRAAITALRERPGVTDGGYGLIGFSFGAPHAIAAAGHPEVRDALAGAAGFGGYCDLERTIRFMMTGHHELDGSTYELEPDPYGRWIVASNYLTEVPGYEGAGDVADALRRLAALTGDVGAPAWDARYDEAKVELRARVDPERGALFDLLAPLTSAGRPDPAEGARLAAGLAGAARRVEPDIEPAAALARVERPVHVLHGRYDHLIPFSEALRIRGALPAGTPARATVTRLFGHSAQDPFPSPLRALREVPSFIRGLAGVLGVV